ncbi:hypothetical protein MRX96_034454 [Rhipicephalus microplus]
MLSHRGRAHTNITLARRRSASKQRRSATTSAPWRTEPGGDPVPLKPSPAGAPVISTRDGRRDPLPRSPRLNDTRLSRKDEIAMTRPASAAAKPHLPWHHSSVGNGHRCVMSVVLQTGSVSSLGGCRCPGVMTMNGPLSDSAARTASRRHVLRNNSRTGRRQGHDLGVDSN